MKNEIVRSTAVSSGPAGEKILKGEVVTEETPFPRSFIHLPARERERETVEELLRRRGKLSYDDEVG